MFYNAALVLNLALDLVLLGRKTCRAWAVPFVFQPVPVLA